MNMLKTLVLGTVLSTTMVANADYQVTMQCRYYGNDLPWWQCLKSKYADTDLKLKTNGQTRVYKYYEVANDYQLTNGNFTVTDSFTITVQNASEYVLGISIADAAGREVYQEEVGQYGVIRVGN
jgi:hypothetical protein